MDQNPAPLTEDELKVFSAVADRVLASWTPPKPTEGELPLASGIAAASQVLAEMDQRLIGHYRTRASQAEAKAARLQARAGKEMAKAERLRRKAAVQEAKSAETCAMVRASNARLLAS